MKVYKKVILILVGLVLLGFGLGQKQVLGETIPRLDLFYLDSSTMKPRGSWDLNIGTKSYYGDASHLTGIPPPDLSSYIPYTGATSAVNLGSYNLQTTGTVTAGTLLIGSLDISNSNITTTGTGTFGSINPTAQANDVDLGSHNLSVYYIHFPQSAGFDWDFGGASETFFGQYGVGQIYFGNATLNAILDMTSITTDDKTFTFPDLSGTIALTGTSQDWLTSGTLGSGTHTIGGSTGITLAGAAEVLTIAGIGGTYNENLTIDFDGAAANTVYIGTGTGVNTINFGAIGLTSSGDTSLTGTIVLGQSGATPKSVTIPQNLTINNALIMGPATTANFTNSQVTIASLIVSALEQVSYMDVGLIYSAGYGTNLATGEATWTLTGADLALSKKISKYNNITTVSNGIPSEVATVDLTAQSAAKSATTIYTPAASGMFRISIVLQVTRAATTSSVLGGATGVVITYTEPDGSVAQSIAPLLTSQAGAVIVPATGNTGNTTTTQSQGSAVIFAKTGVAIQYAIGYTSVGATSMQYSAHLKVEAM